LGPVSDSFPPQFSGWGPSQGWFRLSPLPFALSAFVPPGVSSLFVGGGLALPFGVFLSAHLFGFCCLLLNYVPLQMVLPGLSILSVAFQGAGESFMAQFYLIRLDLLLLFFLVFFPGVCETWFVMLPQGSPSIEGFCVVSRGKNFSVFSPRAISFTSSRHFSPLFWVSFFSCQSSKGHFNHQNRVP